MDVRAKPFSGRHAIVTGGARGIGGAVSRLLAERGADVSLLGRDRERLDAKRQQLESTFGVRVFTAAVDVTAGAAVGRAIRRAMKEMGPVYALVNNAGAAESAAFLDSDDDMWRRMLDVNLMGAVFCSRAVLPEMRARHEGRIVNVASIAGLTGYRFVTAYTAAKHALVGLTRALALETSPEGITVNAVCPGYTDTDLLANSARRAAERSGKTEAEVRELYASSNPGGRLVSPIEVASAVAWLCDPERSAVTGQALVVDGSSSPGQTGPKT